MKSAGFILLGGVTFLRMLPVSIKFTRIEMEISNLFWRTKKGRGSEPDIRGLLTKLVKLAYF